ncbi:MAG: PAS domain-containing protein [Piscinibacter sp.]|nr:PAS domain-containing protein [Piscinibacter sp.]
MRRAAWWRPPGRGAWPRHRTVAWAGGLLIALVVALAAFDIVRGYHATVERTGRELESQARVIAEQTARSMQAVDVVLQHLQEQLRDGPLGTLPPEALHAYLKEKAVGLVQTEALVVFEADSRVRATSLAPPDRLPALQADVHSPFEMLRSGAPGLVIGPPIRGPATGRWMVPLGRRVGGPAGEFAGAVGAAGRVDYFQDLYRDAFPEPGSRVALLHRDGTLLARHPPADTALGQHFGLIDDLLARAEAGEPFTRNRSPVDGADRFGAIRRVPDYPLVVVVTRDADTALAPWRAQALGSVGRTLALAGLAAALLAIALRQLRRLATAHASLAESQERYALAAAGADDGVWDWDLQAGTAYESRRARELQGLPPAPETQPLADLVGTLQVHPEDAGRRERTMQAHLEGRTPAYEVEYRVRHADGQYRWIRVRALCIRDADGRPMRIAGSVSDIDAHKRAEAALRVSEQRFAVAVAGSDDGIWEWDMQAAQVYNSQRGRVLFGLPEAPELLPMAGWFELIRRQLHPEDLPRREAALRAHLEGATPTYEIEFRVRDAERGYRWVRVRGMCVRGADGAPQRIAGSVSDIDARRRAEEGLRLSEERFALAVAGSNDGILDWDIAADRMFASPRAMRIAGVEPDARIRTRAEWVGLLHIHPDDRARHDEDFRRHLEGQTEVREGDYRVRHPDGAYRWVRVRGMSVRDAAGRAVRWAGSVSDIDKSKRVEEALRRSEERYQLAVDGSNEGLWDWDMDGDLLFLSPRAQLLVLAEAGEPMRPRREWLAGLVYHPDDIATVRRAIGAHLRGTTPHFSVEYRLRHHSGGWHWYRQRGVAVRDARGHAYRMAGSMEDISTRKHAEAEREQLERQLRQAQKLEAIGTLAGGIAHDFNNILSAILGYGELAQKDAPAGSAQRRHLDAALAAGARAKSLVERILAFSRSGVGERVPVHVQSVVAEALDAIGAALPAGVTLTRRLAAGDAGLHGDPTQIHQVVMNLCANAVQAMKSAGEIAVDLERVTLDVPLVVATSTLPAGDYLRLEVRDSGSGIAPEVLERIFDPFFTTKQVGVGTGLGLSLVHGIVTDLGGGIAVRSRPGEGAAFTVYLPSQEAVAAPEATLDSIPSGSGETVLLVDDEEPLVRLGEEMLAELGYEAVGFTSSAAALEAFRASPGRFDAVLSDEAMPGMTGSELVRELRALDASVPIVMMSGFVSPTLLARARAAGVAEVLGKPLAARDIARALAAALQRSRARGTPDPG